MRFLIVPLLISLTSLSSRAELQLVPLPASVKEQAGQPFALTKDTEFVATGPAAREAETLAATFRKSTGYALPVKAQGKGISLILNPSLREKLGDEGYRLETSANGARIAAADAAGLFYAGRTLLQLFPAAVFSSTKSDGVAWSAPAVLIEDRPRFAWRGFMLDESRHFFGMEHVKKTLDAMALHKLNRFHWHLTDDEGWRIEIKSYPKLTTIGAWRGTECALPNPREEKDTRYGGFYTQAQLREIVAYAKARHIEIMPEVDVPGHSLAIVTAYPELLPQSGGDGVSAQGFKSNALSPAKPETYVFIEKVFDELKTIFPFEYIHIGGDEVNHNAWKNCPQIKALMEKEKLPNLHEVQVHFTKRLEKIFSARGKRIFGWNEVLNDKLDRTTGIMAWIGTAPGYHAARMGFPVVMAPGPHAYFDMGYPDAKGEPPSHWWAGPVSSERVYAFDPLGNGGDLPQDAQNRIMGVHAALWTEFVMPWKGDALDLTSHSAHADYKVWPRLTALAEVGWTPQDRRDYADYEKRMGADALKRLELLGIFFRVPVPTASHKAGMLTIRPPFPGAEVRYTLDGSLPTPDSPCAGDAIPLAGKDPSKARARVFFNGRGGTVMAGSKPAGAAEWNQELLAKSNGKVEFDLGAELTTPGIWRASFIFTGGNHSLKISGVEILVNGAVVASDPHEGKAGKQSSDHTWRFVIPQVPAGAKVVLRAKTAGDGGNNSRGTLVLTKSERLEPVVAISSKIEGYGQCSPEMAADWDESTWYWTNGHPQAEDAVVWNFPETVAAASVSLLTGERGSTKDQAVGAVLEWSADGTTWIKVADLAYGKAEGSLPAGTKIKALRLRFTAKQNTWVIVHDPLLK